MRHLCRFFAVLFGMSPLALAQVSVPAPKSPVPITAPVSTAGPLPLDVVVSRKDGKPIAGLKQEDFTVYLDGKPQPITAFKAVEATQSEAAPIETLLLMDTVNTRYTNVAYERQQVERYLRSNGGKLPQPVTLVILSDTGTQIMPKPSADGNQIADFLEHAEIGFRDIGRSAGFYGWTEQFQLSASALERLAAYEQGRPGRKLLVWISPGWPLLSGPEVELTNRDQQNLFHTLVGLSASLRKARITLSSVDPLGTADAVSYRTYFYQEFLKGVPTANKMQIGNLALQVLALQSGGRVINSNNDTAKMLATAVSDTEAYYTIRIDSPPAEHPNQYRDIKVTVDKPGMNARTRTGYYAQP